MRCRGAGHIMSKKKCPGEKNSFDKITTSEMVAILQSLNAYRQVKLRMNEVLAENKSIRKEINDPRNVKRCKISSPGVINTRKTSDFYLKTSETSNDTLQDAAKVAMPKYPLQLLELLQLVLFQKLKCHTPRFLNRIWMQETLHLIHSKKCCVRRRSYQEVCQWNGKAHQQ